MAEDKPKRRTPRDDIADLVDSVMTPQEAPEPVEPTPATEAPRPRKKRKDATGRKSDYHQGTATLSVRLPEAQAQRVRELAQAAGQSVNAWLAELIESALSRNK